MDAMTVFAIIGAATVAAGITRIVVKIDEGGAKR